MMRTLARIGVEPRAPPFDRPDAEAHEPTGRARGARPHRHGGLDEQLGSPLGSRRCDIGLVPPDLLDFFFQHQERRRLRQRGLLPPHLALELLNAALIALLLGRRGPRGVPGSAPPRPPLATPSGRSHASPSRRSNAPRSVSLKPRASITTRSFSAPVHCFFFEVHGLDGTRFPEPPREDRLPDAHFLRQRIRTHRIGADQPTQHPTLKRGTVLCGIRQTTLTPGDGDRTTAQTTAAVRQLS